MPDRDKVIDYLQSEIYRAEQSVDDIWLECVEVKLLRDALELLKEQENEIGRITNEYLNLVKVASKKPEIVRCRDCKRFDDGICELYGFRHEDDYYCADGERRSDDGRG